MDWFSYTWNIKKKLRLFRKKLFRKGMYNNETMKIGESCLWTRACTGIRKKHEVMVNHRTKWWIGRNMACKKTKWRISERHCDLTGETFFFPTEGLTNFSSLSLKYFSVDASSGSVTAAHDKSSVDEWKGGSRDDGA